MTQTNKLHSTRDHSELGGSNAARWAACSGSIFLTRTLPSLPPISDAAIAGTKCHELAEVKLRDFLRHKKYGTDPDVAFELLASNYDSAMIEAAEGYQDTIWKKVFEQSVTGKAWGIEDRFSFDENLHMGGIIDCWVVWINDKGQRAAAIIDFKYGYHPVKAKKNAQLAFYAVCFWRWVKSHGKDLDYIKTVIYQPRPDINKAYETDTLTAKQLAVWEKKFTKAAHKIYVQQKASFKTGEHCHFCPAQAICIKYTKELSAASELSVIDPDKIELPSPESLDGEKLAKLLKYETPIKQYLKACHVCAVNKCLLEGNGAVPGFKVVEGTSRRQWVTVNNKAANHIQSFGVDPWTKKMRGLGEISKDLKILTGKTAKDIAILIEPAIEYSKPSAILVSDDDPRPAVGAGVDLLPDLTLEEE